MTTATDPFYNDEERRFRILELAIRNGPDTSAGIVARAQAYAAFVNDPPATTPPATA